jgi:hypothetical protein
MIQRDLEPAFERPKFIPTDDLKNHFVLLDGYVNHGFLPGIEFEAARSV